MYAFCLLAWGLNFIAIKIQGHSVALELSLLYRLAATALVFLLLTWALKLVERIGAAASNYMVALFPAVGGLGSILIGESQPTGYLLLGCALGCLGAAIALRKPTQQQARP